ncbi:hypothetical protein [Brucella intermedia]|uniref:hypothetical protein n=1 Tax=Brucella intermedia TaxID=94625 RepID=UPI0012D35435|nr:hypothetical protein [Brucella intermedia]
MSEEEAQKKTERLHMLMTPDELELVDDWRYANRIATRSEAIRRLVQSGLALETTAPRVVEELERLLKPENNFEPSPEMRALYGVLGPLVIGRLGIRSVSDMQIEVDQSPVLRALWDAANQHNEEEK